MFRLRSTAQRAFRRMEATRHAVEFYLVESSPITNGEIRRTAEVDPESASELYILQQLEQRRYD